MITGIILSAFLQAILTWMELGYCETIIVIASHRWIFLIPGITPGHGNNPAIKLFQYDPNNFAFKNFVTYYMDYWNRDTAPTLKASWDSSFIFSNLAPGYDPSSMNMLDYFRKSCDSTCLTQIIDSIYSAKSKDPNAVTETKSEYVDYENN